MDANIKGIVLELLIKLPSFSSFTLELVKKRKKRIIQFVLSQQVSSQLHHIKRFLNDCATKNKAMTYGKPTQSK